MAFSRFGSYSEDTCYYDKYRQYVLNKLEGRMTAFIFISLQLYKIICISLKTVRGVQL